MLLYVVAILLSGIWLFLLSQGLAGGDILGIIQKISDTPLTKSLQGIIEVATPHMFAIGTLIFVVAHFLLFSTKVSKRVSLFVSLLLFASALLNILAYLFISLGFLVSGWIKLFAMGLFVLVFVFMLGLVAFSL